MKMTIKQILIVMSLVGLTASAANATDINATFSGQWASWPNILKINIQQTQETFSDYLSTQLGCSNVKLCLSAVKGEGIFSKGTFTAQLTASCTATFSNFQFDLYPAMDFDEQTQTDLQYDQGQTVKKQFSANPPGNYDKSDKSLPMCN
jgi:hypothetical protein